METWNENSTGSKMALELSSLSDISISAQKVRNSLKEVGFKSVLKVERPRLLPKLIKSRNEFAEKYASLTKEDWYRVIFSDKGKINRLGSEGRQWVWNKQKSGLKLHNVPGALKYGSGSIILWGCIIAKRVCFCCLIEGNMDSSLYVHIIGNEFIQILEFY